MGEVYPTSVKTLQIKPPSLHFFKMLLLRAEPESEASCVCEIITPCNSLQLGTIYINQS